MMPGQFDLKLKKVLKSPVMVRLSKQLTEHLNEYEDRVRRAMKDFDIKSRDARERSRRQIDRFASQLKTTRVQVEKRVTDLIHYESRRLNDRAVELVKYLKTIANGEKLTKQNGSSNARSGAPKKAAAGRKTPGTKKTTSRKKGTQQKASAGTENEAAQSPS